MTLFVYSMCEGDTKGRRGYERTEGDTKGRRGTWWPCKQENYARTISAWKS